MVHKRDSRCSRVKDTIARFEKLIEKKIVSPLNISIYILLNPSDDKKMLSIKRDTVTTTRGFQKVDSKKKLHSNAENLGRQSPENETLFLASFSIATLKI